jgi:hypothetical protein
VGVSRCVQMDRVMTLVQIGPAREYAGNSMRDEHRAAVLREGLEYAIRPAEGQPSSEAEVPPH